MPEFFKLPPKVTGEVTYPEQGVSNLGDDLLRGIAVGTGIEGQEAGDTAGFLGAMAGMLGPGIVRKVAPKRAAMELVDLLMGRSKRVPATGLLRQLTDDEAKEVALRMGKVGNAPPPPTSIRMSFQDRIFKPITRTLPRDPAVAAAYKAEQRLKGQSPHKDKVIQLSSYDRSDDPIMKTRPVPKQDARYNVPARTSHNQQKLRPIAKTTGSLHNATGGKVLTEREINNMLSAPIQAVKAGMLTPEEGERILAQNKAKIAAYFENLKSVDQDIYRSKMERAISSRKLATQPAPLGEQEFLERAVKAGIAQGATVEDIVAKYAVSPDMVKALMSRK